MKSVPTTAELIAFEAEIAELFNAGMIRAPVHLSGGNEDALLTIFQNIQEHDWIGSTWRSHYHCLLKGVPKEKLKADIIAGRSITLCYPEYKIISSAIVGGIVPICLGIAESIKRQKGKEVVWCFVGDMTAKTGIFHECVQYAEGHDLPIEFIIEGNGVSVQTPTANVWGTPNLDSQKITYYNYELPWPHSGAGRRVEF